MNLQYECPGLPDITGRYREVRRTVSMTFLKSMRLTEFVSFSTGGRIL